MKKKSVFRMFVLSALIGIGMNFHHPITPTLFTELNLPSYVFGSSFAIMCFFGFLTSIFWGEFSDRVGRVNVFAITCIGYGLSQYLLMTADSELGVYFARACSGICSGGINVSTFAYVVDLSSPKDKGLNIAKYTAILSVFAAVGYLLGGFIGSSTYQNSLIIQIIWMFATGILSLFYVAESYTEKVKNKNLLQSLSPFSSFKSIKRFASVSFVLLLVAVFLTNLASGSYDNSFNYYLKAVLDFNPIYNGVFKAAFGITGLIANLTINIWIVKKTDIDKSNIIVLLFCALLPLGSLNNNNFILFAIFNILFFTANAIHQPIIQSMGLIGQSSENVGVIIGIISSIKNLGQVCGALIAGFVFGIDYNYPFILSILAFSLAVIICLIRLKTRVPEECL